MPFEPRSGKHAIIEAVFGLMFSRRFRSTEIDAVIASHSKWRDDLPRLGRSAGMIQFAFGDGVPPPMQLSPPAGGVMFDSVRRDGSLDWRLRVEENFVYVNCLSYTGWTDVYGKAKQYFIDASNAAFGGEPIDPQVTACMIQYIDVFDWHGKPEEYDLDLLLTNEDSFYVPSSLRKRGLAWHLHQGWYRTDKLPVEGRMLERINIDGAIDPTNDLPAVKMDTIHRLEFKEPVVISDMLNGKMDQLLDWMHAEDKAVVGAHLTSEMRKRIGLDV
jgi:uncharacterized protein (TIGR04255 family)